MSSTIIHSAKGVAMDCSAMKLTNLTLIIRRMISGISIHTRLIMEIREMVVVISTAMVCTAMGVIMDFITTLILIQKMYHQGKKSPSTLTEHMQITIITINKLQTLIHLVKKYLLMEDIKIIKHMKTTKGRVP